MKPVIFSKLSLILYYLYLPFFQLGHLFSHIYCIHNLETNYHSKDNGKQCNDYSNKGV